MSMTNLARIIGPPTMKETIKTFVKQNWNIQSDFEVTKFKDA